MLLLQTQIYCLFLLPLVALGNIPNEKPASDLTPSSFLRQNRSGGKDGAGCQWSYCAGSLVNGQQTCDDYGLRYSGRSRGGDCGFGTSQVECCSFASRATDPGYITVKSCEWSYCAGSLVAGQTTCKEYGKTYSGESRGWDCGLGKSQVQCCSYSKVLGSECKRTFTCYGMNYSADYACKADYGKEYKSVIENGGGKSATGCSGSYTWSYKCCK